MKKIATALVVAAATMTSSAMAGDTYVSGSVGLATYDSDAIGALKKYGITVDENATAFKLNAGYSFNDYIAVEAFYLNAGEYDLTASIGATASFKVSGFGAAGVVSYPVTDAFDIYGKLGFWAWESDSNGNTVDGTDPVYGVGASYNFNENVGAFVEYDMNQTGSDNVDESFNILSLGLKYTF